MISICAGSPVSVGRVDRRFEDRARLHVDDFGKGDAETHAAKAQHRVEFGKLLRALAQFGGVRAHGGGDVGDLGVAMGQEFVQRRIEQADRHRQAGHDLEQLLEIVALHRQQLGQRGLAAVGAVGEDHLAHGDDTLALEKHMFGAGEADAFGSKLARGAWRPIGVSALARTFRRRAASAQPISTANSPVNSGRRILTAPAITWPEEPSTVIVSPLRKRRPATEKLWSS